jgi:hypothetical protein
VTQWPWRYEATVSSTAMASNKAMLQIVAMQIVVLQIAALQIAVL